MLPVLSNRSKAFTKLFAAAATFKSVLPVSVLAADSMPPKSLFATAVPKLAQLTAVRTPSGTVAPSAFTLVLINAGRFFVLIAFTTEAKSLAVLIVPAFFANQLSSNSFSASANLPELASASISAVTCPEKPAAAFSPLNTADAQFPSLAALAAL